MIHITNISYFVIITIYFYSNLYHRTIAIFSIYVD